MTRDEIVDLLPRGEPVEVTWTGPLGLIRANEMWSRVRLLAWVGEHLDALKPADEWGRERGYGLMAQDGLLTWLYIAQRYEP